MAKVSREFPILFLRFQDGKVSQKVAPSPKAFSAELIYQLDNGSSFRFWPISKPGISELKSKQKGVDQFSRFGLSSKGI